MKYEIEEKMVDRRESSIKIDDLLLYNLCIIHIACFAVEVFSETF